MAENNQKRKVQEYLKSRALFEKNGRKPNVTKGKPFVSAVINFVAGKDNELKVTRAATYDFQNPRDNKENIPAETEKDDGGKEIA